MTPALECVLIVLLITLIIIFAVLTVFVVKLIKETTLAITSIKELTDITKREIEPAFKSLNNVLATINNVSNATNKQIDLVKKILTTILGASCVALGSAKDKGFFGGLISGFNLFKKKGDKKCL